MEVQEIIQAFKSQETYKQLKGLKAEVVKGNIEIIKNIILASQYVLKSKGFSAIEKLMALRICKEGFETRRQEFVKGVSENILSLIVDIALFDSKTPGEDKGANLFSINPDQNQAQLGKSIYRICFESVFIWAKWYPSDSNKVSEFKKAYDRLIQEGVAPPKVYKYYKIEEEQTVSSISEILNHQNYQTQQSKVVSPQNSTTNQNTPIDRNQQQAIKNAENGVSEGNILKQTLQKLCLHDENPITETQQLIKDLRYFIEKSNVLMENLLEEQSEDLFTNLFDHQCWIQKVLDDYAKLVKPQGITWNQFRQLYLEQKPNNQVVSNRALQLEKQNVELQNVNQLNFQEINELKEKLQQQMDYDKNLKNQITNLQAQIDNDAKNQNNQISLNQTQMEKKFTDEKNYQDIQIQELQATIKKLKIDLLQANQTIQSKNHEIDQINQENQQKQNINDIQNQKILKLEKNLDNLQNYIKDLQKNSPTKQKKIFDSNQDLKSYREQSLKQLMELIQNLQQEKLQQNEQFQEQLDKTIKLQDEQNHFMMDKIEYEQKLQGLELKNRIQQNELQQQLKQIQRIEQTTKNSFDNKQSYTDLLNKYHEIVNDRQLMIEQQQTQSQYTDQDYDKNIKNYQKTEDELQKQIYKLHEENTNLVRENQDLKDYNHQNYLSVQTSKRSIQLSNLINTKKDNVKSSQRIKNEFQK